MKIYNELKHHYSMNSLKNKLLFNRLSSFIFYQFYKFKSRNVKSYIFVATTGRSGTNTFSSTIQDLEDVVSFHEPYPIMYLPDDINEDRKSYFSELFKVKKRIIIRKESVGYKHYVESNHLFCKNFAEDAIMEFGDKIKIVHLIRDPIEVAKSFNQIGSLPGQNINGKAYLLDPKSNDNIIKFDYNDLAKNCDELEFLHCLWYWFEVQARILRLKLRNSNVKFVTFKTDYFNDVDKLVQLFKELEMPENLDYIKSVCGKKENLKLNLKNKIESPVGHLKLYQLFYVKLLKNIDNNLVYNFYT